jgi:hypothetical protein
VQSIVRNSWNFLQNTDGCSLRQSSINRSCLTIMSLCLSTLTTFEEMDFRHLSKHHGVFFQIKFSN